MTFKIIIYLLFILLFYRTISRFFSLTNKSSSKKTNKSGKQISYKDADFEEVD